jgi:LysM repeat protein
VITLVAPDDALATTAPSAAATSAAPPATLSPAPEATATNSAVASTSASTDAATTVAVPAATTPPVVADAPVDSTPVIATGAVASGTAERVEQRCAIDYTVVAGDFWIRLADASGVPLAQLLDANDATVDTPLYPGSTICLPDGATVPAPPTSAAPATTAPPTTTKPVTTTAPTTATPTTVKPVVTYATPSAAAVQQIIRDVWPDELEDRAIEIADRESNFVATAQNFCCYGIFQMHWTAHQSWLAGLGVTTPEQLFDVTTNAYVAYALYQRSGGWGPWT